MRVLTLFTLLVLGALLLSALINYPLYLLVGESINAGPNKLINTTGKLLAIPGFILIIRYLSIADKQGLGYALPRPEFIRELLRGWLSGLVILLVLSIALVALGIRIFKPVPEELVTLLLKTAVTALIAGLLIGFIEETFFRGGLFTALRKRHTFISTMLLSSLLYAAMHFIDPPALPQGEAIVWNSGLQILAGTFDQFLEWRTYDSFLALFVLGMFFALVRERTGNIAYCIGLHAAFVFIIKMTRKFTLVDDLNPVSFLVGYYDGMIGYLSAAGLLIHLLLAYRFWRRPATA
ncbi:MAG: CPBP family intramembrane glutamic endopeptidase [Sedimenticola sp.]